MLTPDSPPPPAPCSLPYTSKRAYFFHFEMTLEQEGKRQELSSSCWPPSASESFLINAQGRAGCGDQSSGVNREQGMWAESEALSV